MNLQLSKKIVFHLLALGVKEILLCPGGRCAPLVDLLSQDSPFEGTYWHFEERNAGFFALGRAKATKSPVAIVTTSGTAVAELLPPVVEAYYSGLPLVVVSADRPVSYRGSGAPQTIEQVGIFGIYARSARDISSYEDLALNDGQVTFPYHLNVCYDEPLIEKSSTPTAWNTNDLPEYRPPCSSKVNPELLQTWATQAERPLVLVGSLPRDAAQAAENFLSNFGAPIYAEAGSGIRECPSLNGLMIKSGEAFLSKQKWDAILRIGGIPTTRLWRDLEFSLKELPVLSISSNPFRGITHGELLIGDMGEILAQHSVRSRWSEVDLQTLQELDRQGSSRLEKLLAELPMSEPALMASLSKRIPQEDWVYLGNSLPIRHWDLAAQRKFSRRIEASRGANGIDGQVSCMLGYHQKDRGTWGIFGDLTTLYDLSAPWLLPQISGQNFHIVIFNNGGGRIFHRMFSSPKFQNSHGLHFDAWAKMWSLDYRRICEASFPTENAGPAVWELIPNAEETAEFWKRYPEIWS